MPKSSMAAPIAEKPTYSRGPDGRTPYGVASFQKTISDLNADTLKQTNMATTQGRRKDAPKGYMAAQSTFSQIDVVRQQEATFRKKEEEKRQQEETALLHKAYKIEKARFEAEWAERIAEVEAECAEKERVLKEVHGIAKVAVEKQITQTATKMRFKSSSTLLGMMDMETKLASAHEYREAAEVAARSYRRHAAEEAAFERHKAQAGSKPREVCVETQAAEMRNLLQKNHSLRVKVRRERELAYAVFRQKYRNLEADQQHAHAIEYHLPYEIGPHVQAQASRSTHASTFRGTLKYESLAGTKFDVPDVSRLPDIPPEELGVA